LVAEQKEIEKKAKKKQQQQRNPLLDTQTNMAHPNLQTNGASLEDCHTNFFALVTQFTEIRLKIVKP
jgi:hypothetical protein